MKNKLLLALIVGALATVTGVVIATTRREKKPSTDCYPEFCGFCLDEMECEYGMDMPTILRNRCGV